jgi:lipopolysaccharide export system ATP-binding protein
LYGGKILKSGDAKTLANDEEVRRIYLGKNFKLDQ